MSAIDLTVTQLIQDEGFKSDAYDDSNGAPIFAHGQITIGYGCRCRQWSKDFAAQVLKLQVTQVDSQLRAFDWYTAIDDSVRQAAVLNMAFNIGVSGLVNGFPNMVNAIRVHDWITASEQCHVKQQSVDLGRYGHIRHDLLVGSYD